MLDLEKDSSTQLYMFYEELTKNQRAQVNKNAQKFIDELKKNGVSEGDIYHLKCTIAKEMFGRKLLND
jgi:hypothetical protein